ncbi:MAG: glycosyltransferase family 9 protein [Nitrospirota bacterium]|nr:glycosyltransferase family 9 protein [Nitrospirota bacterium]MDH5769201.1 glycosyltransferase family 9 protein [Nitrospirota bacterium]
MRYIGDAIWMYPFIKNLKLNLPDAHISALVNKGAEVFLELMPELSEVIAFEREKMKGNKGVFKFIHFLKEVCKRNFDTVFVLSNSDRPTIIGFVSGAKTRIGFKSDNWWRGFLLTDRFQWNDDKNPHMIEYYLQALTDSGLKIYDKRLTFDVPDSAIKGITERFSLLKTRDKKTIIVHPGTRTELRQWGVENFAEVINSVAEQYRIFLIGGPHEDTVIQAILNRLKRSPDIVSTDLSLMEFAALCKFSDLFVGNDSAPIHIAAATGVFVIGIYGPTLSKYCSPWTDKRVLFDLSTVPCRMCRQDKCIYPEKQACLTIVTPKMVIDKIDEILKS